MRLGDEQVHRHRLAQFVIAPEHMLAAVEILNEKHHSVSRLAGMLQAADAAVIFVHVADVFHDRADAQLWPWDAPADAPEIPRGHGNKGTKLIGSDCSRV